MTDVSDGDPGTSGAADAAELTTPTTSELVKNATQHMKRIDSFETPRQLSPPIPGVWWPRGINARADRPTRAGR